MKSQFEKIDRYWNYNPLFAAIVLFVIVFVIWASVTKINEHVLGNGRIVPSGKTQVIQHLEGGIVSEILKSEGQRVKKDEIIYYINNVEAASKLKELQIELEALKIREMRLQAELDEKDVFRASEALRQNYPEIVGSEKQIFKTRQSEFKEKMSAYKKRMKQKYLKLEELNENIDNLKQEISVAREQLDILTRLRKSGAVSRSQYLDQLSKVKGFETRISKLDKEIPIVKTELSEITNLMEEARQKRRSEVGEELNDVKVNIQTIRERIENFEDKVFRAAVRSPVNGIVNKLFINTVGGVIKPGDRLAEVLPLEDRLIVEGRISTNDRGKIWPDLPVKAKVTAYDFTLYGALEGKLTYISPNSFVDNQNNEYYKIKVQLDDTSLGQDRPVYPGMTTELNIISGNISVLHSLLKPFLEIRENALREN